MNFTPWSLARLKELISAEQFATLPLDSVLSLTRTDVSGDASITTNRGKRKYVYDFTVGCDWKLVVMEHSAVPEVLTGSLVVNDVTADGDYEFEVSMNNSNSTKPSNEAQQIITNYVKGSGAGSLKDSIRKALVSFDAEFKRK